MRDIVVYKTPIFVIVKTFWRKFAQEHRFQSISIAVKSKQLLLSSHIRQTRENYSLDLKSAQNATNSSAAAIVVCPTPPISRATSSARSTGD